MQTVKYHQVPQKQNASQMRIGLSQFKVSKNFDRCKSLLILSLFFLIGGLLIFVYQVKIQITKEKTEINKSSQEIQKLKKKISHLESNRVDSLARRVQILSKDKYMNQKLLSIQKNNAQEGKQKLRQNGTVKIIDMLKKDHSGRGIQQVLYDEDTQHKRQKFMQERREFLSDKTQFESLSLIQYNILLNDDDAKLKHEAELTEYQRLNAKYYLNKVKYELPICAVLTGYNNNADFRIELNLNSIFSQNYSNFFVALVNDASDDGSDEVYRKYFAFHNLSSERFVYIENKVRKTALENIYDLIMNHCSEDSIVFNIDADDELIGTNVFKVFNAEYQRTNGGVLYSSMYRYIQGVFLGFNQTSQYTQEQKQQTLYRTAKRRYLQLRTFRADLFRKINITDLKDESGKFYKVTYDLIIMHPLMELSCTHVHWVQESFYLYNIGTGLNDFQTNRKEQLRVAQIARKKPKYSCDPLYIDNNSTSKNSLTIDKKPQQIQQTQQKRMKKTNQKKSHQNHNFSFFKKRKNNFQS